MFYPEEFKNRVKKAYPNAHDIHRRMDEGDKEDIVGRFLGHAPIAFHIDIILAATSLEELQEQAKLAKEKVELFNTWGILHKEHNPK